MYNLSPDENVDKFLETLSTLIEDTDRLILETYDAYILANREHNPTGLAFKKANHLYYGFYFQLISIRGQINKLYNLQ